jgi:hypothetical protein
VRLSGRQQQQLEELQEQLVLKYGSLLASPEGQLLLEDLEKRFDGDDLFGDTPEETAFNLGARAVVRRMRLVRELVTKKRREG